MKRLLNNRCELPFQLIEAMHALNLCAGVSYSNVLRGRSGNCRATAFSFALEYTDTSVPFGKYCLSKPLVFSFDPLCQGLHGSQT